MRHGVFFLQSIDQSVKTSYSQASNEPGVALKHNNQQNIVKIPNKLELKYTLKSAI